MIGILNDIRNYFYILKVIRKHRHSVEWEKIGLKVNWVGQLYKVINLPKEFEGDDLLIRNAHAADRAEVFRKFIRDFLDLGDYIYEAAERKSKRSYLFVWSPIFRALTVFKAVMIIALLILASFGYSHLDDIKTFLLYD